MIEVFRSSTFSAWFERLRDHRARLRIQARIDRLRVGNAGDAKPVGSGISEMRIDHGPGYRIYYMRRGNALIVLLCGGDKSTQTADIAEAKTVAAEWKD